MPYPASHPRHRPKKNIIDKRPQALQPPTALKNRLDWPNHGGAPGPNPRPVSILIFKGKK